MHVQVVLPSFLMTTNRFSQITIYHFHPPKIYSTQIKHLILITRPHLIPKLCNHIVGDVKLPYDWASDGSLGARNVTLKSVTLGYTFPTPSIAIWLCPLRHLQRPCRSKRQHVSSNISGVAFLCPRNSSGGYSFGQQNRDSAFSRTDGIICEGSSCNVAIGLVKSLPISNEWKARSHCQNSVTTQRWLLTQQAIARWYIKPNISISEPNTFGAPSNRPLEELGCWHDLFQKPRRIADPANQEDFLTERFLKRSDHHQFRCDRVHHSCHWKIASCVFKRNLSGNSAVE